jgi:hypothetical protein
MMIKRPPANVIDDSTLHDGKLIAPPKRSRRLGFGRWMVPPDMTVVGIPGKIVRTARRRHRIDNRIDLEHHLMPDPVGDALSALIDRIEFLEARLTETRRATRDVESRDDEEINA